MAVQGSGTFSMRRPTFLPASFPRPCPLESFLPDASWEMLFLGVWHLLPLVYEGRAMGVFPASRCLPLPHHAALANSLHPCPCKGHRSQGARERGGSISFAPCWGCQ